MHLFLDAMILVSLSYKFLLRDSISMFRLLPRGYFCYCQNCQIPTLSTSDWRQSCHTGSGTA